MNPYQHLGEEREEESARSWAQPQGCDGMGWARLGWTGHTMLALGSPGTRQCQLAADLLLAGVTQLGLSSTQQQGDEVGAQARAGAEGWCWVAEAGVPPAPSSSRTAGGTDTDRGSEMSRAAGEAGGAHL